jgi:hypothetical protein
MFCGKSSALTRLPENVFRLYLHAHSDCLLAPTELLMSLASDSPPSACDKPRYQKLQLSYEYPYKVLTHGICVFGMFNLFWMTQTFTCLASTN